MAVNNSLKCYIRWYTTYRYIKKNPGYESILNWNNGSGIIEKWLQQGHDGKVWKVYFNLVQYLSTNKWNYSVPDPNQVGSAFDLSSGSAFRIWIGSRIQMLHKLVWKAKICYD
jgi:hypothetical protein